MRPRRRPSVLFLDDHPDRRRIFREHNPAARLVETAAEAIAALKRSVYDSVSLDHDLGGGCYRNSWRPETGMGVVRWILKHRPRIGWIVVHSLNAEAAERMMQALYEAAYHTIRRPFGFRGWKIE